MPVILTTDGEVGMRALKALQRQPLSMVARGVDNENRASA